MNRQLTVSVFSSCFQHISDWFRVSTKDLLSFEIQALIAMEFNLHLPIHYVLPHLKRLEFENMTYT